MKTLTGLYLVSLTHCPHHFQMHLLPVTPRHLGSFFLDVKSGNFTGFCYAHLGFSLFLTCKNPLLFFCFLAFNISVVLYPSLYIFVGLCLKRPHYIM